MTRSWFSPKAEEDLNAIQEFINQDNPVAAEQVFEAVLSTAETVGKMPEMGRRIRRCRGKHEQLRWVPVTKYPNYQIFYRIVEEGVVIIRILHAAQDWTRYF